MSRPLCENCKFYLAHDNPDAIAVALLKLIGALDAETDNGAKKAIHSHSVNEAIDDAKYALKSIPGFSASREYGQYLAKKLKAIRRYILLLTVLLLASCASYPCDCTTEVEATRMYFLTLTADDARSLSHCNDLKSNMQNKAHQSAIKTNREVLGR